MTTMSDPPAAARAAPVSLADEVGMLDNELGEIDMLITQAKVEAARHEQKRAQTADRIKAVSSGRADPAELVDLNGQLLGVTRRAALMEAQVEVLEGKRKSLVRFRDSLARHAGSIQATGDFSFPAAADAETGEPAQLPPAVSRIVLTAQEDLRREIARAMHDGPAQSLTNIVLQAQIVERLLTDDPERARAEVGLLIGMVQQTLEATKSFIFDVRPMVLDDLGLVPTLRRAARDRGLRAGIAVDFESLGADRRLSVELESGLFRILDEALAAYLAVAPDRVALRLDWSDDVDARVTARRAAGAAPRQDVPEAETKRKDLPPALAAMMDDRRDDRRAAAEAARNAAIVVLPSAAWRDIQQRASTIGVTVELLDGGGTLHVAVPAGERVGADAAG
jgi:two-component system, NarL family, sensor histidine kinase DegS